MDGMKHIMMVGRTEVGKTTLSQALTKEDMAVRKTQAVQRIGTIIDTPGEYIENPRYYRALLLNSYEVDIVMLLNEAGSRDTIFPPGFASAFNREVIGVITKTDNQGDINVAKENLLRAGATKIFEVSIHNEASIEALKQYIMKTELQGV